MTNDQYTRARSKIVGVLLARVAAVILAVGYAIKGDYLGALVLLAIGAGMAVLYPRRDEVE